MHIILLSGGSGKRLWPLSNEIRSKQFIKLFKSSNGEYESMVQRIYRGLKNAIPDAHIVISTGAAQTSGLKNQLGAGTEVCVEPARRDTFPAIALASSYLKYECGADDSEPVVVCPVDPYVDDQYFDTIRQMGKSISSASASILLMGIRPTYASEKYGYILHDGNGKVKSFKEKPDAKTAQKLIDEGALWNGGVFAFKLGYLLEKAHEHMDFSDYDDLLLKYPGVEKISFDYAVVEKEKSIGVVSFSGDWKDLGTWNTLAEAMETEVIGKAVLSDTCENTNVVNELDIPVLCMGLKNTVVAASPDGILVADKDQSSYMKPYVDHIEGPVMYAEKSWGSYQVLDIEDSSLTVKVTLMPGHGMNYHSHEHRDEIWSIIDGEGEVIINGEKKKVGPGDVISIRKGMRHTIRALSELKVMEVQIGKDINVNDKIKHDLNIEF